jgi:protein O-mannosyl-transferase
MQASAGEAAGPRTPRWLPAAGLAAAFLAASLAIFAPAFPGPFVSDDNLYIALNPYVRNGSLADVRAVLDPRSDVTLMVANWAPVHLLSHMLQWRLFGPNVRAFHLTNAVLHAGVSLLLVALLRRSRVPPLAAALGGALFLVHPANVEAVAWISQLKTLLAAGFLFLALLLWERRPAPATLAFLLALFSKALAAIALPVAYVLERARARATLPAPSRALMAWALVFAGFAAIQLVAFFYHHPDGAEQSARLGERLVEATAIGARYLAMAATGYGVSTFHEPAPVASLGDPWFVAGALAAAGIGARILVTLRSRSEEAAWWILAVGSYLPVSQLVPFLFPVADRYLYLILPGLLGGALLAGQRVFERLPAGARRPAARTAALAAMAICLLFAARSHERAGIWVSDARILADSIRNYPESPTAHYVRAGSAARDRDAPRAVAELRQAARSGAFGFTRVNPDPQFNPIRESPEFQAFLRELARAHIESSRSQERLVGVDMLNLAEAQLTIGDATAARATLERVLAKPDGYRGIAQAMLARARRMEAEARRDPAVPADR